MRTSHLQYVTMVEFMEVNGDLSKFSGSPRGSNFIQIKWKELTNKLNNDGTGDSRSEEKWREVWSDYKNNCKKKCANINRAASNTGGGPALQLSLTDLENRVMQIIGVQGATGMVIEEAEFQQDIVSQIETPQVPSDTSAPEASSELYIEDWNTPGSSSQPTVAPPLHPIEAHLPPPIVAPVEEVWRPPPQKKAKKNKDYLTNIFIDADKQSREYARERDSVYEELEKERLKLKNEELRERDYEVQERVRQSQLQNTWLEFMKQAMEIFSRYMEENLRLS